MNPRKRHKKIQRLCRDEREKTMEDESRQSFRSEKVKLCSWIEIENLNEKSFKHIADIIAAI